MTDPRISVVVTSHNYGHFLGSCLDSLLAQSRRAAEIVVIDDGSADGTARLLDAYQGRVTALRTPNRGQAAAFNYGFAAVSGDLVLFVDADDTLRPEAIETLGQHWSDDLAVLGFGLETIDAAGRSTGAHRAALAADRGDNRPRLLAKGTFCFSPTTGMLYGRRSLEAILPMPEPRWRISADCYLVRAAALVGKFGHVPRILGGYRLHGGNNYAVAADEDLDLSRHRANQRDNADALAMLAERAEAFSADPAEAAALRFALRDRAGALRAEAGDEPGAKRRHAGTRRTALLRDPPLAAAVAGLGRPRWPAHLPVGRRLHPGDPGWPDLFVPCDAPMTAPSVLAVSVFAVDPAPEARTLTMELEAPGAGEADTRRLCVTIDGGVAWRGAVRPWQLVRLPVPPAPWQGARTVSVEVRLEDDGRAPPIGVRITALKLSAAQAPGWPVPPDDGLASAVSLASGLDPEDWDFGDARGVTLRGRSGVLRLTAPPAAAHDLLLDFGAAPPRVWLTLREDAETLFAGRLGDARSIAVRLPPSGALGRHALTLQVEAAAAEEGAALQLAWVGLRSWGGIGTGATADAVGVPARTLNLGETVHFAAGAQSGFLGHGWVLAGENAAPSAAAEATLALRLPAGAGEMRLVVTAAPLLPAGARMRHLFAVSLDGEILAAVNLVGPGPIEAPLPDDCAGREIRLGLHSTYLHPDAGPGVGPQPAAPFELRSLALAGLEQVATPPAVAATSGGQPLVQALLAAAGQLLQPGAAISPDERPAAAARLRADLTELLADCADAALLLTIRARDGVARLVALGFASRHCPATPAEVSALHRAAALARNGGPRAETRSALLALLHHRGLAGRIAPDLDALPAPLLAASAALAEYFAAVPDLENAAAHAAWRAFLEPLLESVDRVLARDATDSARFQLATAILTRLRGTPAIFGAAPVRDLIRRHGRCVERLLVRQGARLAIARRPRTTSGRLRLGVLVRDVLPTPEGWALLGMYAALDAGRFEATLIRMERSPEAVDTGARFTEELCLAGLPLEGAVAAIRAFDLDLFVTGAYVNGWEKTTAILAHRLARVQIWATAVCPSTSGLGSFDVALSCRASEPDAPERHYVEPLAWIDGPLQAAYAFPPVDRTKDARARVRAELGVPEDRLLLVSGAMAHKIGDELLVAWAAILGGAPDTILVLYPFAPNWSLSFAHERFRARLDQALAAAGVASERAVLLWAQPPERVGAIAAAADLYLDSFPYTGGTTVCEALAAGTPVVTCAGDALRQLTGAAWVRAFGLPELVADAPNAYVDLARGLCAEAGALAGLRARLERRLAVGPPPHHDPEAVGRAFSDALWRVAKESGLFPTTTEGAVAWVMPSDVALRPRRSPPPARAGAPPVRLAVLTSPRTGSTVLCDLLNRTPGVGCHYELFNPEAAQFVDRAVTDPEALRARDADPLGFLEAVYAQAARDGLSLVGFKLFPGDNPAVASAVVADASFRIVHLTRENLLAQYSSERIALLDGQWFARRGAPPERARIAFDPEDFESWERRRRAREDERLASYAAHGREVLFLDYVNLGDPSTPGRLSRFLGVSLARGGTPSFHRRNTPVVLERFTNPETVGRYLERRGLTQWVGTG